MSTIDKDLEPADSSSSYPVSASIPSATSVVRTRNGSTEDSLSGVTGISGGSGEGWYTIRMSLLTNEWFINDVSQGQMELREK